MAMVPHLVGEAFKNTSPSTGAAPPDPRITNVTHCDNVVSVCNNANSCDNLASYCNDMTYCNIMAQLLRWCVMAMISHLIGKLFTGGCANVTHCDNVVSVCKNVNSSDNLASYRKDMTYCNNLASHCFGEAFQNKSTSNGGRAPGPPALLMRLIAIIS